MPRASSRWRGSAANSAPTCWSRTVFPSTSWGRYAGLLAKVPHPFMSSSTTRAALHALAAGADALAWRGAPTASSVVRKACAASCWRWECRRSAPSRFPERHPPSDPFAAADAHAFAQREPGIVMVARFSTEVICHLVARAGAVAGERGLQPSLQFAGGGGRHANRWKGWRRNSRDCRAGAVRGGARRPAAIDGPTS